MRRNLIMILASFVLILAGCITNKPTDSSAALVSGAPINTQFSATAVATNLKALQAKTGDAAQIVEITIRPASLEAIVLQNGEGKPHRITEGQFQAGNAPSKKEAREGVRLDAIKLDSIITTLNQHNVNGQQLSHIVIEKTGATGYFFSAEKPQTVKTDLAGKLLP